MTIASAKAAEAEHARRVDAAERARLLYAIERNPGRTVRLLAEGLRRAGEVLIVDPWYRRAEALVESGAVVSFGAGSHARLWLVEDRPSDAELYEMGLLGDGECETTTATTTIPASTAGTSIAPASTSVPTTSAAPAGGPAAARSATPRRRGGSPSSEPASPSAAAEAPAEDGSAPATSKPSEPTPAAPALSGAVTAPTAPASPSDEVPMTQADRLFAYVREHPGETTKQIAVGVGMDAGACSGALSSLRKGGRLRSERSPTQAHPPLMCWWTSDASTRTPAGTESPKPAGELASIAKLRAALADAEQQRNDALDQALAADAALDEARAEIANLRSVIAAHKPVTIMQQKASVPGAIVIVSEDGKLWDVWASDGGTFNQPDGTRALEIACDAMRRVALIRPGLAAPTPDDAWDTVSDILVEEAEAYVPDGPMPTVDLLRRTLRALRKAADVDQGSIEGEIAYPVALRLVGEVLGIDTANEGPPTIADLACVLRAAAGRAS